MRRARRLSARCWWPSYKRWGQSASCVQRLVAARLLRLMHIACFTCSGSHPLLCCCLAVQSGLYLLTASMLCTAAEVATKEMLVSLSAGHLLNAGQHLPALVCSHASMQR